MKEGWKKQRTSTNGDGTSRVLNTNQINQISNNTQPEDKVEAIGQRHFNSGRHKTLEVMESDVPSAKNLVTKLKIVRRNMENQTAMPQQAHKEMAGFHIIAGFKATIRSILMDKEVQLTTVDLIKAEALIIKRRLEEKQ